MKHYIFFALMFFSLHLGAQCVIPITEVSKTIYVPIDEIAYVISSGTGASIVRQAGLRQLNTVEDVDSIVSLCSPSLLKFTDGSNGKVMAVSKTFIDRIVINGNGKAVIQTKNARIAYISFEDAEDLNVDILNCYGESKGEVESPGNCIKTITQSAHGFSEGDVLFWDTDKYVNLKGNYTGAEVPLYVVTDSLTANTFTAASCGEVDSDFGLADGLYYATDTGLELAPEDVEYPAVVIYGSKSKVVLNYGLEFDATGKPLFDVLTSTGNYNFVGGQTLPLISDSIAVSKDTIAGVAVANLQEALDALESATPSGVVTGTGTVNAVPKFTDTDEIGNSGAVTNNDNFHFPDRVTIGSVALGDTSTAAPLIVKVPVSVDAVWAEFQNVNGSIRHRFSSNNGVPHARYDFGEYGTTSGIALQQYGAEFILEPYSSNGGSYFVTNGSRYLRTNQWYSNVNGIFLKDGSVTGWRTGVAVFQIDNTTKGFLGPRMTTAQRTAITMAAADAGLQVYDTDFQALMYYNGTIWTGTRYNGTKFQGFDGTNWVDLN